MRLTFTALVLGGWEVSLHLLSQCLLSQHLAGPVCSESNSNKVWVALNSVRRRSQVRERVSFVY